MADALLPVLRFALERMKPGMIKAVIFDFGQTLVDSANGFRQAEKEAQEKLFGHLALSLREKFLDHYRQLRKEFHGRSQLLPAGPVARGLSLLLPRARRGAAGRWEAEYWDTVKAHSILFPEATGVLKALNTRFGVALITNTQGQPASATHRISEFPELERYFRVILVAGENAIPPKPDPMPFRLCLAGTRHRPVRGRLRRRRLAHRRLRGAGCRAQSRVDQARKRKAQLA